MNTNELSERLFKTLGHPNFLSMKGLANEVPIFIQTYEPAQEDGIRRMVDGLVGRLRNTGITLTSLDLFSLVLEELEEHDMTHDESPDGAGDYGYHHPPAGDIDEIRELLRGYGSEESLLKELIQNAEDSEASRLVFMLVPGDPASPHPLLRTAGLCVMNDGVFLPEHLEAMSRLRIGTKGKDARAIGRFGKGLKCVYSVCEAFFVVAATDPSLGWPGKTKSRFFNPRSGWRHQDWDSAYRGSPEAVVSHVTKEVNKVRKNDKPWLAFWLPLRHPDHQTDSKGKIDWIHSTSNLLPGVNPKLGHDLAEGLASIAPSLAILRNLIEIVVDDQLGSAPLCTTWSVGTGSLRASAPGDSEAQLLHGQMSLLATHGANTDFSYSGFVGTLRDSRAIQIKQSDDWPSTVSIDPDGSSSDDKTKGEAHFGAIFSGMPSKAGKLRIKWAVFLPVGDQPVGTRECQLQLVA